MTQKIEKLPEEAPEKQSRPPSMDEMVPKLEYMPGGLAWTNWHKQQPDPDRLVILWINLGRYSPNFYLTHRDAQGNWDIPQGKNLTPWAWAYVTPPAMDQEVAAKVHAEIVDKHDQEDAEAAKKK
jgi:hypothetical protein